MDIFNPTTGEILKIPSPDLSGYVPYTGATGDVTLGTNTIYGNHAVYYELPSGHQKWESVGDFGTTDLRNYWGASLEGYGYLRVGGVILVDGWTGGDVGLYVNNGNIENYNGSFVALGITATNKVYSANTLEIGQTSYLQGIVSKSSISGGNLYIGNSTSGTEKLTNGTFTGSAASWTLGTGWAYSSNTVTKNANGTGTLSQAVGSMVTQFVVGEVYSLFFRVSSYTAGFITISAGGVTLDTLKYNTYPYVGSGQQFYTFLATSNTALTFTPSNDARITIDDVSIQKYTAGILGVAGTGYFGQLNLLDAGNIALETTTGTKIGTATTQKLAFFNSTPIVQPANTVAIDTTLVNLGLRATGGDANFATRVTQPGTFAEIYVADGVTAQSIASGATYTKLTSFTNNGSSSNCTADATNDKITITKAGKYLVNVQISGNDGVAGATFKAALFYDGTEQSKIHSTTKFNAGGEIDSMSMSGILVAAANKDVDVRLAHDGGAAVDFTTQYANLTVTYIGE